MSGPTEEAEAEKPRIIRKLDVVTINRIAAGEILQRPVNALKELLENSLDAGSTSIQVTVKSGGLKLLQIQDNGCGIRKDDLAIVCERFTTSKLQTFDDLSKLTTYGFRGEALSSMSHVAHLCIQTRARGDRCAFKACYRDGKLTAAAVKPCAGNQGTTITVEDLFYNVPQRRHALKSPNEEYQKIYDVLSKYAIHNCTVSFLLKKQGEPNAIRTQSQSTHIENIRCVYGNAIAKHLIEVSHTDATLQFTMAACVTAPSYSDKKGIYLLFINHRLVDSAIIRAAISDVYAPFLAKGTHPFVYMSLELDPNTVDVNIHPTKHEVHFLHDEAIIDRIREAIAQQLTDSDASRTVYTQSRLPGATEPLVIHLDSLSQSTYAKDLVRVDSNDQKLEKFFGPSVVRSHSTVALVSQSPDTKKSASPSLIVQVDIPAMKKDESVEEEKPAPDVEERPAVYDSSSDIEMIEPTVETITLDDTLTQSLHERSPVAPEYTVTNLTSVKALQRAIVSRCHTKLRETFEKLVFVGVVNRKYALIQYETILYLSDTQILSKELFYQILIYRFENFAKFKFDKPLSLKALALFALNCADSGWAEDDGDKDELAENLCEILVDKAPILNLYFGIDISADGQLHSLPILVEDHEPAHCFLPIFLLRLATETDWDDEQNCFETISREIASFYSRLPVGGGADDDDGEKLNWTIEFAIYPAVKRLLQPPKVFMLNQCLLQVTSLQELYKVFERC